MRRISSTHSMNCKHLKAPTKEIVLSSILHGPVTGSWHLPCKIQEGYAVPNSTAPEVNTKKPPSQSEGQGCAGIELHRALNAFLCLQWKHTQFQAVPISCLFQVWKYSVITLSTRCYVSFPCILSKFLLPACFRAFNTP